MQILFLYYSGYQVTSDERPPLLLIFQVTSIIMIYIWSLTYCCLLLCCLHFPLSLAKVFWEVDLRLVTSDADSVPESSETESRWHWLQWSLTNGYICLSLLLVYCSNFKEVSVNWQQHSIKTGCLWLHQSQELAMFLLVFQLSLYNFPLRQIYVMCYVQIHRPG